MSIIAVDFDGTLCSRAYPGIGTAHTAVIEWCKRRQSNGDKLILWTNRTGEKLDAAVKWCKDKHELEFDAVNRNLPERIKEYGSDPRKVSADIYLDDRAMKPSEIGKRGESRDMKTDREYRAMSPLMPVAGSGKRIESDYYVEGIACTFNDPYFMGEFDGRKYYEIIDRRALDGADLSDIIMQYDHGGKVFARNKMGGGKPPTLIAEPLDSGFFIAADLSLTDASKRMYEEINAGLITRMSIGMRVDYDQDEYERSALTVTRTIKAIKKIFDVSAVSIPANPGTEISARSWIDGVIETERREASARLELAKAKYNYFFGGKNT